MEDRAEMAGNLKAELLDVREGYRCGEITQAEAIKRVRLVRERRQMAQRDYRPIVRTADTGREI